jgi:diaminohydroxyphosphoribosylaminopyrimidine deaminase/5-amino-6-(5-phosphoribosylamino)uracil reductase
MDDREAMQVAITCARTVEGRTSPRPPVGAVVIRDGVIIGQGATSPPYGLHAEVHALRQAGSAAHGADLYVTLEPCCVTTHTPRCTDAIIAAGIRRVIVGVSDPNPLVCGRGIDQLRAADIEVIVGIEAQETQELIRPFATFITKGRPYVTAKWAMTLDGKLATHTGDAYWISGPAARVWVHNLRDRVDAILIGSGTARIDNPLLTVRLAPEQRTYQRLPRQGPLRVVLASRGLVPNHLNLLQSDDTSRTCLVVGENCDREQYLPLQERGVDVIQVALDTQGRVDFGSALDALGQRGIMHILLEGGAQLLGSAFDQFLIDHVAVFIAPKLVGGSGAPSPMQGHGLASMKDALHLKNMCSQLIGEDMLIEGEIDSKEDTRPIWGSML